MRIYTIDQMRALEAAADAAGHSYAAMMETAGRAVAEAVAATLGQPASRERRIVALVGPGNNGGDGLVAARELARRGFGVVAFVWGRDEDDALAASARQAGVALVQAETDEGRLLRRALSQAAAVVDALFGTGLSRPIEGTPAAMLAALREARAPQPPRASLQPVLAAPAPRPAPPFGLVAVDVPSGIHGASGEVDPATVAADLTVTFEGPKVGMVTTPAWARLGTLQVAPLALPDAVRDGAAFEAELLTSALAVSLLPARPADGHKGTFGTTLVVGGSANYVGAPALSAVAAGRSGAGLVTLAVPAAIQPMLAARRDLTTATWLLLPHSLGAAREGAAEVLRAPLAKASALVLGPGLGSEDETRRFVWRLLGLEGGDRPRAALGFAPLRPAESDSAEPSVTLPPTVIDADGLNALAAWEGAWWERIVSPLVLTPHPGEMARLLGRETSEVQAARLATAREAAARWGQVVVLKGAHTVVAAPDGRAALAPFANDALAKAGSGDVLAGTIGALLGQGLGPYDAARLAVLAHGLAGEQLRTTHGSRGTLASDLLDALPAIWAALSVER